MAGEAIQTRLIEPENSLRFVAQEVLGKVIKEFSGGIWPTAPDARESINPIVFDMALADVPNLPVPVFVVAESLAFSKKTIGVSRKSKSDVIIINSYTTGTSRVARLVHHAGVDGLGVNISDFPMQNGRGVIRLGMVARSGGGGLAVSETLPFSSLVILAPGLAGRRETFTGWHYGLAIGA